MPWPRPLAILLLLLAALDRVTPFTVVGPTTPIQKQQRQPTLAAPAASPDDDTGSAMLLLLERLGPRLGAVFRLVPPTARVVADVGCDHFSLGLALALDGGGHRPALARVIGVDKAAKPLEQARRNVERVQTRDDGSVNGRSVELRHGDGLKALRGADAVDTVAIAGMGTRNIVEVLGAPAAEEVLGGVEHLVLQAYDPRPLFMRDLRMYLTTTLRDCRLGPGGAGYAIADESIVRAEGRTFITLLARAAQESGSGQQDTGLGGDDDNDQAFRRLLLGQHLGRRARQEAETRVVYEEYLRHHRKWFAKLLAVRGSGKGNGDGTTAVVDPAARALVAIERELTELDLDLPEPM